MNVKKRQCELNHTEVQQALILAMTCIMLLVVFTPSTLLAEDKLTALFTSEGFTGSFKVIAKFNIVGYITNFIISAFCYIGLAVLVVQLVTTFLYLSNRPLFNKIADVKKDYNGKKAFGFKDMFSDISVNKHGSGVDTLLIVILSLLPNIKEYSYYCDGHDAIFKDDDTIATFAMKVSLPSILSIFFFSMGFSNTLWQAWGTVADSLGAVGEKFVSLKLDEQMEHLLNTKDAYSFSLDASNTEFGDIQQTIAESAYKQTIKLIQPNENGDYDATTMQTIGSNINTMVTKVFTWENVQDMCGQQNGITEYNNSNNPAWAGGSGGTRKNVGDGKTGSASPVLNVSGPSDTNFKNVSINVVVNYVGSRAGDHDVVIPICAGADTSELGTVYAEGVAGGAAIKTENGLTPYIHVVINKKASVIDSDYTAPNGNKNNKSSATPTATKQNKLGNQ